MKLSKFISEFEIYNMIQTIVKEIKKNHMSDELALLGILKGSFIFMADLIRELSKNNINIEAYFIDAKSYNGSTSTEKVKISGDLTFVENKSVIIVEDIYDTGLTLKKIINDILKYKPNSLEVCVLLYKEKQRDHEVKIDYIGFKIPDKFVVGYGLDYNEKFRGLPYIGVIEGK